MLIENYVQFQVILFPIFPESSVMLLKLQSKKENKKEKKKILKKLVYNDI